MTEDQHPRSGMPIRPGTMSDPNAVGAPPGGGPPGAPPITRHYPEAPPDAPPPGAAPQGSPPVETPTQKAARLGVKDTPFNFEHDVIKKLKQELGIQLVEPQVAKVAGHVWLLRTPTFEDVEWAMGQINDNASAHEIHATNQVATLAISIIAIDGVPIYQLWGIDQLVKEAVITDPLNPPTIVKYIAAERLLVFLRSDVWTSLIPFLWAEYIQKIDALIRLNEKGEKEKPVPFDSTTSGAPASQMSSSPAGENSLPEQEGSQQTTPPAV